MLNHPSLGLTVYGIVLAVKQREYPQKSRNQVQPWKAMLEKTTRYSMSAKIEYTEMTKERKVQSQTFWNLDKYQKSEY